MSCKVDFPDAAVRQVFKWLNSSWFISSITLHYHLGSHRLHRVNEHFVTVPRGSNDLRPAFKVTTFLAGQLKVQFPCKGFCDKTRDQLRCQECSEMGKDDDVIYTQYKEHDKLILWCLLSRISSCTSWFTKPVFSHPYMVLQWVHM